MSAPLLDRAGQASDATIIVPLGCVESIPSIEAGLDRIRAMAQGQPVEFRIGMIAHPDVRPFLGIRARVDGACIATLGDRWHDEGDVRAALRVVIAAYAQAAA